MSAPLAVLLLAAIATAMLGLIALLVGVSRDARVLTAAGAYAVFMACVAGCLAAVLVVVETRA